MGAALDDPTHDRMAQADIDTARQYGLSGVPAPIFNNKYLISGAQPVEALRRVVKQIAQGSANEL